jgi:hypothetical protein
MEGLNSLTKGGLEKPYERRARIASKEDLNSLTKGGLE